MNFPQYRKYSNNKSYFRLSGPEQFEELNIMGNHYQLFVIEATKLPDRNFYSDLLLAGTENILVISEKEFNEVLDICRTARILLPSHSF